MNANARVRVLSVGAQSAELARSCGSSLRESCVSSCGREALKLFRSKAFDVVLSDLQLSDMTAMEVLKEIKRTGSDLTFVVTIDMEHLRDALLAMIGGASGYVVLGQSAGELLDRIESARRRNRLNTLLANTPHSAAGSWNVC